MKKKESAHVTNSLFFEWLNNYYLKEPKLILIERDEHVFVLAVMI